MYIPFRKKSFPCCYWLGILGILFSQAPVDAQRVIEDGTLPTRVTTTDNLNFTIDSINNTNRVGKNLFHSFKEFSIPTGGSAIFNNSTDVVNIINRVTGGNISNIDGLIKANGNANLFLINSNGIVFGKNAQLDIGGSFVGSTAESIKFADGEFSAIDTTTPPLLTINVPLGLQMGSNSAAIEVQGGGYTSNSNENDIFTPFVVTSMDGLRVKAGNTLALVAGEVSLNGGIVTADSGRVELAGVNSGFVNINSTPEALSLSYQTAENFGDINIDSQALVDASGTGSGYIQFQGKNILLDGGSKVFLQSRGTIGGGEIKATATDSIKVKGRSFDQNFGSRFLTTTIGTGNAAEILIVTPRLLVSQVSGIVSETFSQGQGGNITINASELLQVDRISTTNTNVSNNITTFSFGSGKVGDINIYTKQLSMFGQNISSANYGIGNGGNVNISADNITAFDGGVIASATFGFGDGGDVKIDAKSIYIKGINFENFTPSSLAAVTLGIGNAGSLNINTENLVIENGGRVDASTLAFGNSGSITINATDFVEVTGTVPGSVNPSLIISSANITDEFFREFLGLPDVPSGNSGNITINTPILKVYNGAEVTVRNDEASQGGVLNINANSIFLESNGKITASTQSGGGGDIDLQIKDALILRNQSLISAEAGGIGNGGNININSPVIVGLENSDIIANAEKGNGGNIKLNTQGLLGLQFRDELTLENDITASSQFGINGNVEISNPEIDPSSSLSELPSDVLDSNQQVASGCSHSIGSSFTIVGKGGLAENPEDVVTGVNLWQDLRDLSILNTGDKRSIQVNNNNSKPIVEATGWIVDKEGNIEFVARGNNQNILSQASSCKGEVMN